ncbi:MAG: DNA internalization-related competence protein ComEC/Rec2 [Lachnospiraceae bacterium]|jgi:competence protein ComEC
MKRPVVMVCVVLIFLIIAARFLKIPLLRYEKDAEQLKKEIDLPCEALLYGEVKSVAVKDNYSVMIIEDVYIALTGNGSDAGKYEDYKRINNVKIFLRQDEKYDIDSVVKVSGKLKDITYPSNPGQFDSELYSRIENTGFTMSYPKVELCKAKRSTPGIILFRIRNAVRCRIFENYSEETARILCAMLLGDKTEISEDVYDLYKAGGIAHILVVSSLHLSVFGMGLFNFLRKLGAGIYLSSAVSSCAMLFYISLAGFAPSSIRALVMFLLMLLAKIKGRVYDIYSALALAAVIILISNPYYLFSSSFILSFSAVLSCVLAAGMGKIRGALIIFFGMVPACAYCFFEISLFGIFFNFFIIPVMPLLVMSGVAGTAFGGVFSMLPEKILFGVKQILILAEKIPFSRICSGEPGIVRIIIYYAFFVFVIFFMKRNKNSVKKYISLGGIPILFSILLLRINPVLTVSVLDVGQGDCAVISSQGINILVDGGSSTVSNVGKNRIIPFLKSRGITHLDYVIATHADSDHISGIKELIEYSKTSRYGMSVGKIAVPDIDSEKLSEEIVFPASDAGIGIISVSEGDRIVTDNLIINVISPEKNSDTEEGANENCIVFELHCEDFDALFTGDIEGEGEKRICRILEGQKHDGKYDYDYLKVSHHGSAGATKEEFLNSIPNKDNKLLASVSYGKRNFYGHPSEETLERLKAYGAGIKETAKSGAIFIKLRRNGYHISSYLN